MAEVDGRVIESWSRLPLRAEDVGLAAWNLVSVPIGAAVAGSWFGTGRDPFVGIVEVLALLGLIVAIGTRTSGAPPITAQSTRGWLMAGPLIGAAGLIGANASDRLGLDLGILGGITLLTIVGSFAIADRLPVLPERHRRLLTAPFVFLTAAFFSDVMAGLLDGMDVVSLAASVFGGSPGASEATGLAVIFGFALFAASVVFYTMLIVAPRELAVPEPDLGVWFARYALFAVSAVLGVGGWVLL